MIWSRHRTVFTNICQVFGKSAFDGCAINTTGLCKTLASPRRHGSVLFCSAARIRYERVICSICNALCVRRRYRCQDYVIGFVSSVFRRSLNARANTISYYARAFTLSPLVSCRVVHSYKCEFHRLRASRRLFIYISTAVPCIRI